MRIKDFTITIIDEKTDRVAATGTILIEHKFVHKNGLVGHIEDIAVDSSHQGKKLGLRIIEALKYIGQANGCYKSKIYSMNGSKNQILTIHFIISYLGLCCQKHSLL